MDNKKKKHLQSLCVKRTRLVVVIRKALKKTQQQMADILGMSRPTYIKEENSQQISELFYLAIGSYWDSCYRESLEKWRNNPDNNEYKKFFIEFTKVLDNDNLYRIKNTPPVDDDYEYFISHSFNQEWWETIKKGSYNELDDVKLDDIVKRGHVLINIDEFDAVEMEKIFDRIKKTLKKYNKKVYILTDNKEFEIDNLSEIKIKEVLSSNDEILSILLKNRPYIDFSLSKSSYNEGLEKLMKISRYKLLIIDKKINFLNDIRFTTNKKAKIVLKKVLTNKKFPLFEIGHYSNIKVLYVKWNNNKLVYHDLYYDELYKEIPNDAILAYVLYMLITILPSNISLEEQHRIENILKEEFPEYKESLRESVNNAMMNYLTIRVP